VVHGDEFEGVVTRRRSRRRTTRPTRSSGRWSGTSPGWTPCETSARLARLMIDSDSQLLPVFEGPELIGVVTVDAILRKVKVLPSRRGDGRGGPVRPTSSRSSRRRPWGGPPRLQGEPHHAPAGRRGRRRAVGILSLYDVTDVTVRSTDRSQGGNAGGTDSFGGDVSRERQARPWRRGSARARGTLARLLDLPVRDVMVSPVRSIRPDATLDVAVDEMFDVGGSSLVVTDDERPFAIVTKTDVLDALTWEAEGNRGVQVYGADLVDDVSYEDIVAMVDGLDEKDREMTVLETKLHLHEHDEKQRGTPLCSPGSVCTPTGAVHRVREGYGASQAIKEARDVLERQIRDEKTYGRTKKHPDEEFWEKRFGWMLQE